MHDKPPTSTASARTERQARILVVASDPSVRRVTSSRLDGASYQTESVETAQDALDACVRSRPNLVITDLRLMPMDGLALLKELKSRWPQLIVIMLTPHFAIPRAEQAIGLGAFSYLVKPVEKFELLGHVKRAIAVSTFKPVSDWQADIAARGRLMTDRIAQLNQAAHGDSPVLLTGENGTGKELLARAIHAASSRRDGPFVGMSCKTAVDDWLERELFGRAAGDAHDGIAGRSGAIEAARNGTLFIQEIGNLPPRLQPRFMDELSGLRLICTTSCDLQKLVDIGKLRKDLYERLSVLPVEIPPLGRRREDIPLLVSHFLEQATDPADESQIYTPKAIELLATSDWPETVRQLFNLVKQSVALTQVKSIDESSDSSVPTFDEAREKFSRDYLAENLRMTEGNVSKSARLAKRNRTDFYKLLARYRLRPDDFKNAPSQRARQTEM